jgi:uncharacterized protein with gpF-like domain
MAGAGPGAGGGGGLTQQLVDQKEQEFKELQAAKEEGKKAGKEVIEAAKAFFKKGDKSAKKHLGKAVEHAGNYFTGIFKHLMSGANLVRCYPFALDCS